MGMVVALPLAGIPRAIRRAGKKRSLRGVVLSCLGLAAAAPVSQAGVERTAVLMVVLNGAWLVSALWANSKAPVTRP